MDHTKNLAHHFTFIVDIEASYPLTDTIRNFYSKSLHQS